MPLTVTKTTTDIVSDVKATKTPQGEQKISAKFNGVLIEQTLPITGISVVFLDPLNGNLSAVEVEGVEANYIPILMVND